MGVMLVTQLVTQKRGKTDEIRGTKYTFSA